MLRESMQRAKTVSHVVALLCKESNKPNKSDDIHEERDETVIRSIVQRTSRLS